MKEKIVRLSKEIFEYERPELVVSEKELTLEVQVGNRYQGELIITNSLGQEMKGVVYTSHPMMRVEEDTFTGTQAIISYTFYGQDFNIGEIITGMISIVSSCGECEIPFLAQIEVPYCITSLGKVKDLFHFANLAKTDWAEAVKLFKSKRFEKVFLYENLKNTIIYRSLLKSVSPSQAMEEFLIGVRKKLKIQISIDKNNFNYSCVKEKFMDKITLTKDQWGYTELTISTDAVFIIPDHKRIWTDSFLGNTYILEFVIDPAMMRKGNNFGRIYIKSVHQLLTIEISATCPRDLVKEWGTQRKIRKYWIEFTKNYLDFRLKRITVTQYFTTVETLLDKLKEIISNQKLELLKIHLDIMKGKTEKAKEKLDAIVFEEEPTELEEVINYCGLLYLKALLTKEDTDIEQAVKEIITFYEEKYSSFSLLWFLLYLDTRYEEKLEVKVKDIKKQFEEGNRSPVLYFEVCALFNKDPSLIHQLDDFTIQTIDWGIKENYLSKDAAVQYIYLTGREKGFRKLVYQSLVRLYKNCKSKDVLTAICQILIKGQKISNQYFKWYEMGVNAQLRITQLHEYYMYSLDEETTGALSQQILMYFMYESNLPDRKKAYLYASIIRNKKENPTVYKTYLKQIEQFALRQILLHNIGQNLAIIYEDILKPDLLNEQLAKNLPIIMFRQEVVCTNKNIIGVYVVHKELEEEVYIPLSEGKGQMDIFTENAELFFVDKKENRFYTTIDYTINKFLHLEELMDRCYELSQENKKLLLNLFEKIEHYQRFDKNAIPIRKHVLMLSTLRDYYKKNCFITMIKYYYDNLEADMLEECLDRVDLSYLTGKDRGKIIEYCIIRGKYEKALDGLEKYGIGKVSLNYLQKLCLKKIQFWERAEKKQENSFLIKLTYYVFSFGKYNENILNYLVEYYQGTTIEMIDIWKGAKEYKLETRKLEERLLAQVLFSEKFPVSNFDVFYSYYNIQGDKQIIKAYLCYFAYQYFVCEKRIEPALFSIMKKEIIYEENQISKLALLKYYSNKIRLEEDEKSFCEYNLHLLIEKGIIFPFYKKFSDIFELPETIVDRYYIEYRTNPNHIVQVHYRIIEQEQEEAEYITEILENVYMNMYNKSFILFYNEILQYYITEQKENGEILETECFFIQPNDYFQEKENAYHLINLMLLAREMKDDATLVETMKHYIEIQYAAKELFQPL